MPITAEEAAYLRALEGPEDEEDVGYIIRRYGKPPGRSRGSGGGGVNVSVSVAGGQANPTSTTPINFTVTFSEPVTGFTNADVVFTGTTTGGTPAATVTGTGPSYNVAVSGVTGNGVVMISIPAAAATTVAKALPTPASNTVNVTFFTAVAYVGPGDVVASARAWWGLRAYSNATKGGNAIRLRRDGASAGEQDFTTLSDGTLDVASIAGFLAASSGATNLWVTTLYDQTGNGFHVTQPTSTLQAVFTLSGLGAKPIITASTAGGSNPMTSAGNVTSTQPMTVSSVVRSATGTAAQRDFFGDVGKSVQSGFGISAVNQIFMYAGAVATLSTTDHVWHSIQWVFSGAASDINVEGTVNTVNASVNNYTGVPFVITGNYDGDYTEVGFWPVAFTPTQRSNMYGNQSAYWGPFVAAYVGPGDVVASATAWWGLRAYSAAKIGTNAIRLRRDSDNTEQNFVTLSDGTLDVASITTFKGAANLFVVTLYDQVGTNHFQQATAANQPPFILSVIGTRPALSGAGGTASMATAANMTIAQPNTVSCVAKSAAGVTTQQDIYNDAGGTQQAGHSISAANQVWMYAGAVATVTTPDNNWNAIQWVFNGAASDINLDGSVNTRNPGAAGQTGSTLKLFGAFVGSFGEMGLWPSAFSSGQSSSVSANQHTYWGF